MLKLYNSLSGKVEEFKSIDKNQVRVYCCGMTVYDKMHLGHAKTYVSCDILIKLLRELYKDVVYVRNITDVDDKIINRAKLRNIAIQDLTKEVIEYCQNDLEYLGNEKPTIEPKATEHIQEIIILIQKLIQNGYAYEVNGSVFFDVLKYKDYGKLSNKNINELLSGARIEVDEQKHNPLDFVLWKPQSDKDDISSVFDSPWGKGRPGWHIECSAMSTKYLSPNFDIHCGGMDLKFPHHENEIAQSRCAFLGSNYANYWFHTGFLMVNGEKMSKSLGNFITIQDLRDRKINGKVLRFLILKNHYRTPLDFKETLIEEAKKNLTDLCKITKDIDCKYTVPQELIDVLCDDLNTPKAIALLNKYKSEKKLNELKNSLLFLNIYDEELTKANKNLDGLNITENEINNLIQERKIAKQNKDWTACDKIRDYLKEKHIILKDNSTGCDWEIY